MKLGSEQQGGFSPSGLGYYHKVDEWPHEGVSLLFSCFDSYIFLEMCVCTRYEFLKPRLEPDVAVGYIE
jgi:hypothetical protein